MNQSGTLNDAAAVFSALRGDQVIELLSRLETNDAQQLLATAARTTTSNEDLERASSLLEIHLKPPSRTDSDTRTNRDPSRKPASPKVEPCQSSESLDFLIHMPDQEIRVLLTRVSTACWAPALKPESDTVREIVFSNVAPAVRAILKREIASCDGNRDVAQSSRRKIIDAFRDLTHPANRAPRKRAG